MKPTRFNAHYEYQIPDQRGGPHSADLTAEKGPVSPHATWRADVYAGTETMFLTGNCEQLEEATKAASAALAFAEQYYNLTRKEP